MEGTYTHLLLTHVDVWQKRTQYCKAIVLQLKINKFIRKHTITGWYGSAEKGHGGGCIFYPASMCLADQTFP